MEKTCPIERLSADGLALILGEINYKDVDKKPFVNFWIACFGYSGMRVKLKSALLQAGIPHNFEKTKYSTLSQYLISATFNAYVDSADHFVKLWQTQKSMPKMKSISLDFKKDQSIIVLHDTFLINKLLQSVIKFSTLTRFAALNVSFDIGMLKYFPVLISLEINTQFQNLSNLVLPNLSALKTIDLVSFKMFPNLVKLHVIHIGSLSIDLHELEHLEELVITTQKKFGLSKVQVKVSSLFLRLIDIPVLFNLVHQKKLSPSIYVDSQRPSERIVSAIHDDGRRPSERIALAIHDDALEQITYPLLTDFKLNVCHNNDSPINYFGNICDKIPNVTSMSVVSSATDHRIDEELITSLSLFANIISLNLENLRCFSEPVVLTPLWLLVNLKKLGLKKIELVRDDMAIINELIHARVKDLSWIRVATYDSDDEDEGDEDLNYCAPTWKAISNLDCLTAELVSSDWMDLIPKLIEIRYLHLINCETVKFLRNMDTITDYEIPVCYPHTAIAPDEFLVKFNARRHRRIKSWIDKYNFSGRICEKFHFEEKSDRLRAARVLRTGWKFAANSMSRATMQSLLGEDHTKDTQDLFECFCDGVSQCDVDDCSNPVHPRALMTFIFESHPD
jgi:hypothetical protein